MTANSADKMLCLVNRMRSQDFLFLTKCNSRIDKLNAFSRRNNRELLFAPEKLAPVPVIGETNYSGNGNGMQPTMHAHLNTPVYYTTEINGLQLTDENFPTKILNILLHLE
ncbi:hypothetical protein AVEN_44588-1, partial [Araneus ventricosus]